MELEDQVMLSYTQARYVKKHHLKIILRREMEIVPVSELMERPAAGELDRAAAKN